jgi:SRSO17 transposase
MVALRLFLPESWTGDRVRLERAGVPVECRTARSKPEIALVEIDRVIAAGVGSALDRINLFSFLRRRTCVGPI